MTLFQILLLPFTLLYILITDIRNWLYDKGYKRSIEFNLPVISVGNLTVGGTGKTPHVEYLIGLLSHNYSVATLSRGYGRKTKGFLQANEQTSATDIGDEPMQFYYKFASKVIVTVGEKRAEAIPQVLTLQPNLQVIILDDAYQHRAVKPSLSILLTDYHNLFYRDVVLPSGRLRERRTGARRADIIIVSKCPQSLTNSEQEKIIGHIRHYSQANVPIYFTSIQYGQAICFGKIKQQLVPQKVLLVSGLADPKPLERYIKNQFHLCDHLAFKDHHHYTERDLLTIKGHFQKYEAEAILVTEKDYVKLKHSSFANIVGTLPFYYLPIKVCFLFGGKKAFDEKVFSSIIQHPN